MFKSYRTVAQVLALLLCLALAIPAAAQSNTLGAIGGTVSDPQGAVIPNASITAKNLGTNKESTATTDSVGRFRIPNLEPGTYTVTVNAQGFGAMTREKVVVEVGLVTSLDLNASVTGAAETLEVVGEAPVVNVAQQDFAQNINQTSINELPINGRRWSNFALLTPGTSPDGNFGLISFRGISGLLNNSTVDGGDNNQAFFSEERGRTRISYVVSQASIQEFQVNTSNFSAEYGRAAGGVVNAVTKSGTNNFHGGAFYYIRDNELGARNPFSFQSVLVNGVAQTVPLKPKDRRHQFGGTLGGPIVKDKLFFFFSYDQQKRDFPGVAAAGSPTFLNPITVSATAATGTPGRILADRGITQAETDAALSYLRGLTGVTPRKGDQTIFFPKVDWQITDNHRFSASYNRLRWESPAGIQTQPVVRRGTNSFGDDFVQVDSVIARMNSALSNTISNEFKFQFGRDFEFQKSQEPGPGEPTTGFGRPPQVTIGGGTGIEIGKPEFLERGRWPDETRLQYANTTNVSAGNHLFKFGFDINKVNDDLSNLRFESGAYSYSNLQDFISDRARPAGTCSGRPCYSSYRQGFGPVGVEFDTWDYGFFFQDDWRVHPRFTLNLGVRYEYQTAPDAMNPNPALPATSFLPNDKNNWGPRTGFAWDVTGDSRTSLRGGYGIYFGRIINAAYYSALTNTGMPTGQLQYTLRPADPGRPTFPNVLNTPPAVGGGTAPDVQVFADNAQNPTIHQTDIILEREIAPNTVVSVSYLGSFGRNLAGYVDRNLNAPTGSVTYKATGGDFDGMTFISPLFTGARPNPSFGRISNYESFVESTYHGFVAQFNRRMTGGLQYQVNYTFSRATDNGQSSNSFIGSNAVLNPYDLAAEEGLSNFHLPHKFTASAVWQPAVKTGGWVEAVFNNWTVSPILSIASGRRVTPFISGNVPSSFGATSTGPLGVGGTSRPFWIERNTYAMKYTQNLDLRLSRRFRIVEGHSVEFLGEVFNLQNRVNDTEVNNRAYTIGTPATGSTIVPLNADAAFLTPTAAGNTLFRERQVQFAVRYQF